MLYDGAGLDCSLPICDSCIAGMTGMYHCAQPLVKMESCKLFAWASLEL
jgi:hypothetical protein